MTLTEALNALHEAGRLRSPWLPGMLVEHGGRPGPYTRLALMAPEGIAGIEPVEYMGVPNVGAFPYWGWPAKGSGWTPTLSDPATVGCLLALLREASGDPRARPEPYLLGSQGWHITGRGSLIDLVIDAPAEGGAIGAALIALAEAL